MTHDIKASWRSGTKTINGWITIASSFVAECMAHGGFDSVTVDLQHGLLDYSSAMHAIQGMQPHRASPWVRVPANEPGVIGKVLDLGFKGLICPMVNSVDDARRLVAATRYPPLGERSYGPTRALLYEQPTGFVERSNRDLTVLAMIETREALAHVNEICTVDGIDGVYIGPNDLGISMGYGAAIDREEEEVLAAFDTILAAARKSRKFAGIHTASADYAARMLARGFDMATLSSDANFLQDAIMRSVAHVRSRSK